MRFPAYENQTLKRPEWALASDLALATWVRLATQAAIAENGGRFVGAASWDDRAWTVMAGVSKAGVDAAMEARICHWEDADLVVDGYDSKAETIVQQRRENGRLSPGRPPKKTAKTHTANRRARRTGTHADNRPVNHTGNHARKALSSPSPSSPLLPLPRSEPDSSEPLTRSKPEPGVFDFEVVGGGDRKWSVTADHHAQLVGAFPGVEVADEYAKAAAWLSANPTKRKTARGMPKFLFGWCERAQNGPPRANGLHVVGRQPDEYPLVEEP